MGNRIAKHIVEPNQSTRVANASLAKSRKCGKLLDGTRLSSTYYILDAQGNPLAMYELDYAASSFELTERQIYGSARLGSLKTKVDVFGSAYEDYSDVITTHAIGDRNYELSNHLGNILTVVSDKLHPVDDGNGDVASYTADLVMSCDYSPFGVTLDGRGVEGSYRYRFQGQEMDDEIKGEGNSVNYKYRMHCLSRHFGNPRVGRFFAVDPLAAKYPHNSVYAFSENRVIDGVELEGLEVVLVGGSGRASAIFTGSFTSGIIFDLEGNVGYFTTVSFGAGIAGGASAGFSAQYMPYANNISELEGWGISAVFGGYFMAGATVSFDGALDFNPDNSQNTSSAGGSASVGVGVEVIGAGEGSYTWITQTSWSELALNILSTLNWNFEEINLFVGSLHTAKDELEKRLSEEQKRFKTANDSAKKLHKKWKDGDPNVKWSDIRKQQKKRSESANRIKEIKKMISDIEESINILES